MVLHRSDFAFGHALERDGIAAVEKLGGTVVGHVRAPFGTSDFSSFLLQAQQSNASVIAFGTAGADTVNLLKQAAEFHLAKPGVRVVPLQLMIDEVKAIGLELGQGNFALMAFHRESRRKQRPGPSASSTVSTRCRPQLRPAHIRRYAAICRRSRIPAPMSLLQSSRRCAQRGSTICLRPVATFVRTAGWSMTGI